MRRGRSMLSATSPSKCWVEEGEVLHSRSQRNRRRNGREGVTKVRRRVPPEGRLEGQTHQRRWLQEGKRRLLWMSKSRLPLPWAENAVSRGRTGARLCGLQTGFQEAVKGTGELGDRCSKECKLGNWRKCYWGRGLCYA